MDKDGVGETSIDKKYINKVLRCARDCVRDYSFLPEEIGYDPEKELKSLVEGKDVSNLIIAVVDKLDDDAFENG